MTQQGKPGWYPDGTGQQRWWDGRGWTGHTRSLASAAEVTSADESTAVLPVAAAPVVAGRSELPAVRQAPAPRRRLPNKVVAGVTGAALLFGMLLGSGFSGSDHGAELKAEKLTATVSGLRTDLRSTTSERDALQAAAADVAARSDQLDSRQTELDEQAAALSKRSGKLDSREKKVAKREAAADLQASAASSSSSSSSSDSSSSEGSSSAETSAAPGGATAQCTDGTYSYSAHRSGTCSHHGGVASWL